MVAETIERLTRLDILVNNAGIEKKSPFWEVTENDYDQVLDVNLKAVFFATQAMVQRRGVALAQAIKPDGLRLSQRFIVTCARVRRARKI